MEKMRVFSRKMNKAVTISIVSDSVLIANGRSGEYYSWINGGWTNGGKDGGSWTNGGWTKGGKDGGSWTNGGWTKGGKDGGSWTNGGWSKNCGSWINGGWSKDGK